LPTNRPNPSAVRAGAALVAAALLALGRSVAGAPADHPPPAASADRELKSAFLYGFSLYVEWPRDSAPLSKPVLTFCVIGDDALAETLPRAVHGKSVLSRPVAVRHLGGGDSLSDCGLLYVGDADALDTAVALSRARQLSILTVGESEDFLRQGGIIRLYAADNRFRFEVNVEAAEASRLKLSSRLLNLARAVQSSPAVRR
jgi:hypothetical protein